MLRSSPQFGFTLLTYELLQRALNLDFQGRKLEGSKHLDQEQHSSKTRASIILSTNPDHVGGFHLAQATFEGESILFDLIRKENEDFFSFLGIETRFGLAFPKYRTSTTSEPSTVLPPLTTLLGVTPHTIAPK